LKSAAALIAEAGVIVTPLTLARRVSGGKTLLATIASGGDGAAAAQSLIRILRLEAEQQERLAKRFASRDNANGNASDYGLRCLPSGTDAQLWRSGSVKLPGAKVISY